MKVHGAALSPFVRKVLVALELKGLDYEQEDTLPGTQTPEFLKLSPMGKIPAFEDGVCHATINVDRLDPECELNGLVVNEARPVKKVEYILNNSFGMLGINSAVVIKRM